ncbi:MAG: hypothetical protein OXH52_13120 [Gammaproteobacteria bacterium]|nr:hypothetical protein [Gammaproteobacteria bacterium]
MNRRSTDSSLGIATIGWILLAVGLVVMAVLGFQAFLEAPLLIKLLLAGVYGGLGLLLVSVLRQRLIERKSDKYLDVDI